MPYVQDAVTGDFWPEGDAAGWRDDGPPGRRGVRPGLSARVRRRWLVARGARRGRPGAGGLRPARSAAPPSHDVAWVATGASVTLPGTDVTPVNLARGHVGAKVTVGSLPSALAYAPGGRASSS